MKKLFVHLYLSLYPYAHRMRLSEAACTSLPTRPRMHAHRPRLSESGCPEACLKSTLVLPSRPVRNRDAREAMTDDCSHDAARCTRTSSTNIPGLMVDVEELSPALLLVDGERAGLNFTSLVRTPPGPQNTRVMQL